MITKKNVKKYLQISLSSLWWCAIILLAILLTNIFVARINGRVPSVFGYSIMNITTGSMEDEIPVGSYILVKKTAPEDIEENDIICFYSDDPSIYGMPNTHRVVDEPRRTENGFEYTTRGDSNHADDAYPARSERLIGKYVKTLTVFSRVLEFISTKSVLFIIVVVQIGFGIMMAYSAIISLRKKSDEQRRREIEEEAIRQYLKMQSESKQSAMTCPLPNETDGAMQAGDGTHEDGTVER